jgi:hypothetical protein
MYFIMLSNREKKIRQSIELMFSGLDDDVLKTVMLYTALGKTEAEKDAMCEEIKRKQEEDMQYYNSKFEIELTKENSEEVLKLINPACLIELTDVVEKSNDNIEEDANN